MLMNLPENFKALDDATKEELRYQVVESIMIHAYETTMAEKNPPSLWPDPQATRSFCWRYLEQLSLAL
jgi:hypothetical protein